MATYVKEKPSWSIQAASDLKPKSIVSQVYFPTNRAYVDDKDKKALATLCNVVRAAHTKGNGNVDLFMVVGNADHRGKQGHNLSLSKRRAQAVGGYLKSNLPGAIVYWRAIGESNAQQPELGDHAISQKQLAHERRVDVFYGRIGTFTFDKGTVVTATPIDDVVKEAIRIVKAKQATHPNQSERLLCYLTKLRSKPTNKNDKYWAMSDFEACWRYAYPDGKFSMDGLRRVEAELIKRARSARGFMRAHVDTKTGDDAKFKELLELDKTIFQSYALVVRKLSVAGAGGERMFPYWVAIKNTLHKMIADGETLYSCIKFKAGLSSL